MLYFFYPIQSLDKYTFIKMFLVLKQTVEVVYCDLLVTKIFRKIYMEKR